MRKLDYSRQFVLDFGSVSSKFNRCSLIDEIFIRYEIDRSFVVIISLSLSVSLSLQFSHYHNHHRLKFSSFLPRNNEVSFFLVQRRRKSFSSGREGKKKKKNRRKRKGRGEEERKGRERFREEKYAGSTWKRERIFPGGLFLPPLPLRVEAREVARPTVKRGREGGAEREGRSERKTRRNGPTAQQKRDKSSTLIRILPLFALWNTILNGMGAQ